MTEQIKYFAKLSSISILSFLKINFLGAFSTIVIVIIEFFLLTKDVNVGHSGHVSAIPLVIITFANKPIGSILWYLTCILSPIAFFIIGNKYILMKLANRLITDKSDSVIYPLLEKVLMKFKSKETGLIKNTTDFSLAKLKLIQQVQNESENKVVKKVIVYGMKKINLDDVDFTKEDQDFYDIIKIKTVEGLKSISKPSRKPLLIIFGIQFAILLFIYLTKC